MSSDWLEQAVCAQIGSEVFFPLEDDGASGTHYARARRVCAECPVWRECRIVSVGETDGMWAGTSRVQRQNFRAASGLTKMATQYGSQDDGFMWTEAIVRETRAAVTQHDTPDEALAAWRPDLATQPYFHTFDALAYVAPVTRGKVA